MSYDKLNILCLHGYNNTADIFKYQLRNYTSKYDSLVDFHFLDGPYCCNLAPLESFVKKGFTGSPENSKPFPGQIGINVNYHPNKQSFRYHGWSCMHKDS